MLPGFVSNNTVDGGPVSAEHANQLGDGFLTGTVKNSDSPYFGLSQLGKMTTISAVLSTMHYFVLCVFAVCPPLNVTQSIVGGITIREVPALHSIRAGANEGLKNQRMNGLSNLYPILIMKGNDQVSSTGDLLQNSGFDSKRTDRSPSVLFDYDSRERFHSATVAHSVETNITRHIPPAFFAAVGVPLNSLIEPFRGRRVSLCHRSSPVKTSRVRNGAGGLDSALQVAIPSPAYSTRNSPWRVEGLV